MKTRLRHAALWVAAVAVMLTVAPPAGAQAPAGDSVVGQLFDPAGAFVLVDARSGPFGENPTGTAQWSIGGPGGFGWVVGVTCLAVSDNTAVIGFSGTHNPGFEQPLRPVAGLIRVVDGGGLESGQDSFEWAETLGPGGGAPIPGPTDCSSFPSTFDPRGIATNEFGDIVVTDSKPFPTQKGECKNGGWRNYPGFKNQGDCVSYVATGGEKPPAKKPG
jgi:hypothetical protein